MSRWSKVWGICLSLTLLLLMFGGTRAGLHCLAREGVYPFENGAVWIQRSFTRLMSLTRASKLAARNRDLEREVARLRGEAERYEQVATEHRRMLRQLGARPDSWGPLEPCLVLSRGGSTGWWRQIRVNKGHMHGLRRGAAVLSADGLVGRVVDVSPTTAEVRLITDANSRIACRLDPVDSSVGVVRGILHGGGWRAGRSGVPELLYVIEPLRLRYLERDYVPPPRTRVVTSGLGGLPAGLPVGYLLGSEVDEGGLYRLGDVMPVVDLNALSVLFVLRAGEETDAS